MEPRALSLSRCLLLLTLAIQPACGRSGAARAVPIDPISGILDKFHSYQIVALGEGLHGNEQGHEFRLALVRDPRFPALVDDIVVEFGNSRYQAVMDRFIQGGDVPYAALRRVWQDTINANPLWDSPIYEEFFRAVRGVNASLAAERQLRMVLGGPPIDWETVTTHDELQRGMAGGGGGIEVIKREVLSRNRRALVIYGDGHFRRYSKWRGDPEGPARPTLLNSIESEGIKVFSIWGNTTVELERMQRSVASWPVPSLTVVRGTRLGTVDFKYFAGMETAPPTRMEEQFDAVLYLGPVASITMSELSPSLCADAGYVRMRLGRLALGIGGLAGRDAIEFTKFCESHKRQLP